MAEWDFTVLDRIVAQFPGEADAWLRGVAQTMTNEIMLSFNTSPPGRVYRRGKKIHVASTSGNPPNVDTGALRASMKWRKMGNLHYEISDGVEYGVYLEYGTEKMGHRPFVRPVFAAWQDKIADDFIANLGGLL